MKKVLLRFAKILLGLFIVACGLLYFFQERLIFFPQKLDQSHQFEFEQNFEELTVNSSDGISLHGLLFKSDSTKGLIFYLHGNAGSLDSWGRVAKTYTDLNYDVFMLDYRGYGKSEGKISNQQQLFQDNQAVYYELKKRYSEEQIAILGYSIGTGLASKLASDNSPRLLILQAPYYSLTDLMRHTYPFIPTFILKYKFETNEFLQACVMPIVIFHGTKDRVIYFESSVKLHEDFRSKATFIPLAGQGHNGMTYNDEYLRELVNVLNP